MIHQTAIIDPSAIIGDRVSIGPYSIIGEGVTIGDDCWIGPHVVISGPTSIGNENKIFQFCSIGEAPQDLKYGNEPTQLKVGDRNVIREFVTFNRGSVDGHGITTIGSDNFFMAYSHVAHDCTVGDFIVFSNAASLAGHVSVGSHSVLGGFTSVHQFTTIGTRAFCGLGSVVTQDIPPFSTAAGNRAKTVAINKVGLKRNGFSSELVRALHNSFRALLVSKTSKNVVLAELQPLREKFPEVDEFVSFVVNSKRGIAR
ncbi:MAG: acyl-ACP--UDP-N-acetylglucosamine O-acyltransferase [Bacteroidetes bacterium]|nr:acyl-ACP--UDP-N-acetylglucosamine O-acyltransferase [Bacteroidota bacterium]